MERIDPFLPPMEMWQQQNFESFGAWRRATEKARRAAKKKEKSSLPASESARKRPRQSASPQQFRGLRERVDVTPGGSRVHTLERTTPRGTVLTTSYTSPAGGRAADQQHPLYHPRGTRDSSEPQHLLALSDASRQAASRARRDSGVPAGPRAKRAVFEREREQSSLPSAEPPQGKASQCVHAWLTEEDEWDEGFVVGV